MEQQLVNWLRGRFGETEFAKIGIGDDCAVLKEVDREIVLTCDVICEGVHFHSTEMTPEQIGRKAMAVNLSDLASMGAEAKTVLVSLTLPDTGSLNYAKRLFLGMEELSHRFNIEICGGDTTIWSGGLTVAVTAVGLAPKSGAWRMDGAEAGDSIVVTGAFGGSILKHHWAFVPCLDFADQWRNNGEAIHACTDASDSLGIDLQHIAKASSVGFEINLDQVPIADAAWQRASSSGKSALEHALTDGEDFQLIMAVDPGKLDELMKHTGDHTTLDCIGHFTEQTEFIAIDGDQRKAFDPAGYEHSFRSADERE